MNWLQFLNALCKVESSMNPNAIGDKGKAVGILQAHPEVIIDVNSIYGTTFTNEDRLDPSKSKAICVLYVNWYTRKQRIGRDPDFKDYALCWHYGPNYLRLTDKDGYWDKVLKKV